MVILDIWWKVKTGSNTFLCNHYRPQENPKICQIFTAAICCQELYAVRNEVFTKLKFIGKKKNKAQLLVTSDPTPLHSTFSVTACNTDQIIC